MYLLNMTIEKFDKLGGMQNNSPLINLEDSMFKKIIIMAAMTTLVVSCSSKKKQGEGTEGSGDGAPEISSTNMNFDPTGSDSGAIDGLFTINFPYDSVTLDEENREKLKKNAEWLKSRAKMALQVEGHCDSRGSTEYNLALGERRAKAVKAYLVSLGLGSDRLRVVSYGEEKLIASGETEDAHAKNRRANFVPLPQ